MGSRFRGFASIIYGNKYIVVVVDYVNKYVEGISLPTNECKNVLRFLCKNIFARFESPSAMGVPTFAIRCL